jgi:hypothetical protein
MPRQPTAETSLKNIAVYLTQVVTLLDELNAAFGSSFVHQISRTTLSLITVIQARNFIFLHVLGHDSPEHPECEEEQR